MLTYDTKNYRRKCNKLTIKNVNPKNTLFKLPNPSLLIASIFHWGNGGLNETVLGTDEPETTDCFNTPKGKVHNTASPVNKNMF